MRRFNNFDPRPKPPSKMMHAETRIKLLDSGQSHRANEACTISARCLAIPTRQSPSAGSAKAFCATQVLTERQRDKSYGDRETRMETERQRETETRETERESERDMQTCSHADMQTADMLTC